MKQTYKNRNWKYVHNRSWNILSLVALKVRAGVEGDTEFVFTIHNIVMKFWSRSVSALTISHFFLGH